MRQSKKISFFSIVCILSLIFLSACVKSNDGEKAQKEENDTVSSEGSSVDSEFSFRILQTGKSDCTVFTYGDSAVLIDTADADDYTHIKEVLDGAGVSAIEAILISHYDKDHIGSVAALLQNFTVGALYGPDYTEPSETYDEMYKAVAKYEVPFEKLKAGSVAEITFGGARFVMEAPEAASYDDDNDYSVITTVSLHGENYLFLGDSLKERMGEFNANHLAKYELVKTPHHGDYFKALKKFIEETEIGYAVICAEEGGDTLEEKLVSALEAADATILYNYDGDITFTVNPLAARQ